MTSEHAWLERLAQRLGSPPAAAGVLRGIGDDAAVLTPGSGPLLVTVDASVEGVHFTREIASLVDIGYRATMAAASDVAAMGGRVRAIVAALTVTPDIDEASLDALASGQTEACAALGAALVGGNIARGPVLSVTTTVIGEGSADAPVIGRGGAKAGESLYVYGPLGQAAAGLRVLLRGDDRDESSVAIQTCVRAWRRPVAFIDAGRAAARSISSAIDVSDGLAQDAGHIARASRVAIIIDEALAVAAGGDALRDAARALGEDAAALALGGGEDYALVASATGSPGPGWARIGRIEAGPPSVVVDRGGVYLTPPAGFDHLR